MRISDWSSDVCSSDLIKVRAGGLWLLANVRDMRLENPDGDLIVANVDFLGEGIEDPVTGRLKGFRRGVTRFPVPGTRIFPVTQDDMEQIFSAFERPHISIGTEIGRAHV